MNDYSCGCDATAKKKVGQNADPSNKTTCNNGQLQGYAGFPVGCTSQSVDNSFLDQDTCTIRQWLVIFGGNASTSIIDTSLYGDITIDITLAPAGVLMLSPPVGTLATYASVTNTETNSSTTLGTGAALTPTTGTGYTLSDLGFEITHYDMPQSCFDAVVLQVGAVFKLYNVFLGAGVGLPRSNTSRLDLSTQSLDMVISTFQVQDRDTQQAPIFD